MSFGSVSLRRAAVTLGLTTLLFAYVLRLESTTSVMALLTLSAALLVAALFRLPVEGVAVGCLAGAYVAALLGAGGGLDAGAPLFGVGLFLLTELLYVEKFPPQITSADSARSRAWSSGALALGGFLLSSAVLVLGRSVALAGPLALATAGLVTALLLGSVLLATRSLLAPDPPTSQDR